MDYNLEKLKMLSDLDAENAITRFDNSQAYFEALDIFLETNSHDLRQLNPVMIVYGEDVRKDFFNIMSQLRERLTAIGANRLINAMDDLTKAAEQGNIQSLTDGLRLFHAEIDILTKQITETRETDRITPDDTKPIILAVDDMPELLTAIVGMLKDTYTVIGVTSGEAALKALTKHKPALFLLDIEMPHMNGYVLAKRIRNIKTHANTPIIFLTAKNSRTDVLNAMKLGCNDYVIKPVNQSVLQEKLKKLLH